VTASDWMLPEEAFAFLRARLLPVMNPTVVELGSGEGTLRLRQMAHVVSIEHDEAYLRAGPGAHFIHAPIERGWYSSAAIRGKLPDRYDCLVVDGPPGVIGRAGLLEHLDLFLPVPLLVDDVHRSAERELAIALARRRGTGLSVHYLASGRAFATIGWPP